MCGLAVDQSSRRSLFRCGAGNGAAVTRKGTSSTPKRVPTSTLADSESVRRLSSPSITSEASIALDEELTTAVFEHEHAVERALRVADRIAEQVANKSADPTIISAVDSVPQTGVTSEGSGVVAATGSSVLLHVYDVSHGAFIQLLNMMLANKSSPVKCGGIFHVGVEVYGKEWVFGYCKYGSGVSPMEPRTHPDHHFRETVEMPATGRTKSQLCAILRNLMEVYQGDSYNLFSNNCCHFADDLCRQMGSGPIPVWVYRLAGIGNIASGVVDNLSGRSGCLHLSRSLSSDNAFTSLAGPSMPQGDAPPPSPTIAVLPPSAAVGSLLRGTS